MGMFGWRKKQEVDGKQCPLCQLVNTEDADQCTRCYYEFTVAAHRQTVSEVSSEEQSDLFDALLGEDDQNNEDETMVDWTSHKFTMDDMTVEVSPYDDDGIVEVDKAISLENQFDSPNPVARVKKQDVGDVEDGYVLTAADAPKNAEKFDYGSGPDLSYVEEQHVAPVVKLVEITESEDREPVQSASSIDDLDEEEVIEPPQTQQKEQSISKTPPTSHELEVPFDTEPPKSVPVPQIPNANTPSTPQPPSIPVLSATVSVTEAFSPLSDSTQPSPIVEPSQISPAPPVVQTPSIPLVPSIPSSQNSSIWPWPQSEPWEDPELRKSLRETMEAAKSGNIDDAKRSLVSLGPHLGERIDLIFHIGVLLKRFGQEETMQKMIQNAQVKYPDSAEVSKAVEHLLDAE
jgi:hypothetical protein